MRNWLDSQEKSVRLIAALAAEARAARSPNDPAAWADAQRLLESSLVDLGPEKPEAYEDCYLPEQRADLARRIAAARRRATAPVSAGITPRPG
jgi:hypothetical protein